MVVVVVVVACFLDVFWPFLFLIVACKGSEMICFLTFKIDLILVSSKKHG